MSATTHLNSKNGCDGYNAPIVKNISSTGYIRSPNYPASYSSDVDCLWHVEVDGGKLLYITFLEFDLESGYVRLIGFLLINFS